MQIDWNELFLDTQAAFVENVQVSFLGAVAMSAAAAGRHVMRRATAGAVVVAARRAEAGPIDRG